MNDLPERAPDDGFAELDDTLADGPGPAAVPNGARAWLADQRFVHGMLRALHTADAAAREGRVMQLLARIDAEGQPVARRRHWREVALAALLLAAGALWALMPARLPTADAAVSRAVAELARDVNRKFRLEMTFLDRQGKEQVRNEFALVTRPGARFRIDGKLEFGGVRFGELRIGCDGHELWLLPADANFRRAAPIEERERLMQGFGDVLDLGYLDVHKLVEKMPADFDLRVVGRERGDEGRQLLRIEATRRSGATVKLVSAWLLCDEATGMVTRIEAEAETRSGFGRRLRLSYLGEEPPGLVDYRRPW